MSESLVRLAALRRRVDRLSRSPPAVAPAGGGRVALGHDAIDAWLDGGLARGKLHEIVAGEVEDAAAAAGFAAMLAQRVAGPIVWLRAGAQGALHAPGLAELGLDPARLVLVAAPDPPALLRAAAEVTRCGAVGVAVIELWRANQAIDLTASRRLALAAEGSGATPLLLRIAADPLPNAAHTRWAVRAVPSTPLAADAPGLPAFELELLRHRGGRSGVAWRVEWNRDRAAFSTLPGAVAAIPAGEPLAGARHAGAV